jgi:arsenate reductase
MAEAYMKLFYGDSFNCYSAGLEQGKLNPMVVKAMQLDGIDISNNQSKSVDIFLDGKIIFDYVVTVCDESSAEKCPYFPGGGKRIHIGFKDPSGLTGTEEDKLNTTIEIRDRIKERIRVFIKN